VWALQMGPNSCKLSRWLSFDVQNTIYTIFYNVVNFDGFDAFNQCTTYVMGILPFPICVNGTYEYIAIWTSKHYIQQ
jgi:hypothetical protein